MHAYHEELPGYDPDQIWFDGCGECEWRGHKLAHGIAMLDNGNLDRAIGRAMIYASRPEMLNVSHAEYDLLGVLAILVPRLAVRQIRLDSHAD